LCLQIIGASLCGPRGKGSQLSGAWVRQDLAQPGRIFGPRLYPADRREILDCGLTGLLADPENAAKACEGFVSALSKPGYLRGRMFGNDC
jgi:hypothetical protein